MCSKSWVINLSLVISFLVPLSICEGRDFTFTNSSNTLNGAEEMNLTASYSGFSANEQLYIKGAFYKEGSTNYFGFTKNGDSWIKNSTKTIDQCKVDLTTWDRTITVKTDSSDTGFSESGIYKFKIGYYLINSNNEVSSVIWSSNIADIQLTKVVPTVTPIPTVTPTKIPTPRNTQIPSIIPTKVTIEIVSPVILPSKKISLEHSTTPEAIAVQTIATATPTFSNVNISESNIPTTSGNVKGFSSTTLRGESIINPGIPFLFSGGLLAITSFVLSKKIHQQRSLN